MLSGHINVLSLHQSNYDLTSVEPTYGLRNNRKYTSFFMIVLYVVLLFPTDIMQAELLEQIFVAMTLPVLRLRYYTNIPFGSDCPLMIDANSS